VLADAAATLLTWVVYVVMLAAAIYVVTWPVLWGVGRRRANPGRTRGWRPWAIWIAAAALVAAVAAPLSASVERRMRIAKGQGDVLLIGKALAAYAAHCGGPPPVGAAGADCPVAGTPQSGRVPAAVLTAQRNARGVRAGPFLEFVPRLPRGWTGAEGAYRYLVDAERRPRVCATGDGIAADSAATGACP